MTKQKYTPHVIAASVLFTLGNAIILMPQPSLLRLGLMLVLSLTAICIMSVLIKMAHKNKFARFCVSATIVAAATYGAATAFSDYLYFLTNEQLQISVVWLGTIFALLCLYFATREITAIYKYCLFSAVLIFLIMSVCFVGGIDKFNFDNVSKFEWDFSLSGKNYCAFFISLIILPSFTISKNKSLKPVAVGVTGGFLLLFEATLQIFLTLGDNFDISYPYLNSVGVISSGSLFTRLDGLVWFVFFVSALVKSTICIKTIITVIRRLKT